MIRKQKSSNLSILVIYSNYYVHQYTSVGNTIFSKTYKPIFTLTLQRSSKDQAKNDNEEICNNCDIVANLEKILERGGEILSSVQDEAKIEEEEEDNGSHRGCGQHSTGEDAQNDDGDDYYNGDWTAGASDGRGGVWSNCDYCSGGCGRGRGGSLNLRRNRRRNHRGAYHRGGGGSLDLRRTRLHNHREEVRHWSDGGWDTRRIRLHDHHRGGSCGGDDCGGGQWVEEEERVRRRTAEEGGGTQVVVVDHRTVLLDDSPASKTAKALTPMSRQNGGEGTVPKLMSFTPPQVNLLKCTKKEKKKER